MGLKKVRFFRAILVASLILGAVVALVPGVALGHARYIRSEPAFGEVLAQFPRQVTIWFTQELASAGNQIKVLDQRGNRVDNDDTKVSFSDPKSMSTTLKPLSNGVYLVEWSNVSAEDGDTLNGSFTFRIGQPASTSDDNSLPLISVILSVVAVVIALAALVMVLRRTRIR